MARYGQAEYVRGEDGGEKVIDGQIGSVEPSRLGEGGQLLEAVAGPTAKGAADVPDMVEAGNGEENAHHQKDPSMHIWKKKNKQIQGTKNKGRKNRGQPMSLGNTITQMPNSSSTVPSRANAMEPSTTRRLARSAFLKYD